MPSSSPTLGATPAPDAITAEEAGLARAAAVGDGAAFATLYDRYERRIFTYCQRLLASPEDAADATQDAFVKVLQRLPKLEGRDLNFSAYLYTAARNASYDMIGRRKKAEPVDVIPEPGAGARAVDPGDIHIDPERHAMLSTQQEEVRAANIRLPERQREVLVLREVEELSYDEIAEIMGMNRNSVAQLISRARIKLRDEMEGGALAGIAGSSPECERALPLIAMRQDRQLADVGDAAWLEEHLVGCATCRVSVEAMEEAGVSYRAWLPIVPFVWLREAAVAKASEAVGADWSAHAHAHADAAPQGRGPGDGGSGVGGSVPGGSGPLPVVGGVPAGIGATGVAVVAASAASRSSPAGAHASGHRKRRRILAAVPVLALLFLGGGLAAIVAGGEEGSGTATLPAAEPAADAAATGPGATGTSTTTKTKAKTTGPANAAPVTVTQTDGSVVTQSSGSRSSSGGTPRRRTTTSGGAQPQSPNPGIGSGGDEPATPTSTGTPPGSGTPPVTTPPVTTPPVVTPPVTTPPVTTPPTRTPPSSAIPPSTRPPVTTTPRRPTVTIRPRTTPTTTVPR